MASKQNSHADDVRTPGHDIGPDAGDHDTASGSDREKYRDGDDARAVAPAETRDSVKADSRFEARGDARENVGNNARGTDTDPKGPEFNDRTRHRSDRPDTFDDDLKRDNMRGREASGMSQLEADTRAGMTGMPFVQDNPAEGDDRHGWRSHARQGQAESPVELTHNEPRKKVQGHGRDDDK
jgi:hypothetical protein